MKINQKKNESSFYWSLNAQIYTYINYSSKEVNIHFLDTKILAILSTIYFVF